MRHFQSKLLVMFLAAGLATVAEENPHYRLRQALVLIQEGQFSRAITIIRPLIDSRALQGAELGRAWALVGFAYEQEGQFPDAHNALDESIHVLRDNPSFVQDYAAALNYEGDLIQEEGQPDAAERVWLKALKIFEEVGNRVAGAEICRNLAEVKLQQAKPHEARVLFEKALSDANAAGALAPADNAAYALTEGWLDLEEKHIPEAVRAYGRSLEFCKMAYGENHFLTGWGLMLLGSALAQAGQLDQALAHMRNGLVIIDQTLGRQNPKYWVAQLAYSQVLDRAGSHSEAAKVKKDAQRAIQGWYGRQCVNCTISVSALR